MATQWGQRRALGRRYSQDPALLMELDRLEKEYSLAPGREARALQASQFDRGLAQQQSQFDTQQANAASAGQAGTAVNLATNAAMIRGMTMEKGEPFFGRTVTGYYDKMMGNQPAAYGAQPASTQNITGQAAAGGYMGGTASQYVGAPAPAMDTLARGGMTYGNYPGYGVSPATMPEASAGVGVSGPTGGAASGGAVEAAGAYGAQGGIGTGIGELSSTLAGAPIAAPAAAGMMGKSLMKSTHADEWMQERTGIGGKKDWGVAGGVAAGAAAGAVIGGPIGAVAGGVIGGIASVVSDIFGW